MCIVKDTFKCAFKLSKKYLRYNKETSNCCTVLSMIYIIFHILNFAFKDYYLLDDTNYYFRHVDNIHSIPMIPESRQNFRAIFPILLTSKNVTKNNDFDYEYINSTFKCA